ncbi:MAG: porin family protein [Psychromonas sp.]|nr:porin family protein [Psychromonas sp.]
MNKLSRTLCVLSIGVTSSFVYSATSTNASQATVDKVSEIKTQVQKVSGFYAGGTIGTSKLYIERGGDLGTSGVKPKDASSSAQSLQLLGGYQFNRIIAVELAYDHYLNGLTFKGLEYNTADPEVRQVKATPKIYAVQANVGYTFHNGWRPFAITGISSVHLNTDYNIYNNDSDSKLALRIGLGVEYAPIALKGLAFRASWINDRTTGEMAPNCTDLSCGFFGSQEDDLHLHRFNLGATYKF